MTGRRDYHWQLIRMLMDGAQLSAAQITESLGCNRGNTERIINNMHHHGLIYVIRYSSTATAIHRVWAWRDGDQEDVPRPNRVSNSDRCAKYRWNQKVKAGEVRLGVWGL